MTLSKKCFSFNNKVVLNVNKKTLCKFFIYPILFKTISISYKGILPVLALFWV